MKVKTCHAFYMFLPYFFTRSRLHSDSVPCYSSQATTQLKRLAICAYRGTLATSPSAATVGGFFTSVLTSSLMSFVVSFSMWSTNSLMGFLQGQCAQLLLRLWQESVEDAQALR